MVVAGIGNSRIRLSLLETDYHLQITLVLFYKTAVKASSADISKTNLMDWMTMKALIDTVNSHVCGDSSYEDMRTLLIQNWLWSDYSEVYLRDEVSRCCECRATAKLKASHKVSLSSLNRCLNDFVVFDHLFLEVVRLMNVMDSTKRYSAGEICNKVQITEWVM